MFNTVDTIEEFLQSISQPPLEGALEIPYVETYLSEYPNKCDIFPIFNEIVQQRIYSGTCADINKVYFLARTLGCPELVNLMNKCVFFGIGANVDGK